VFRYIVKRILHAIPLLILVSLISFLIINLAPGDPVLMFVNPETANTAQLESIRANLGLDKPIYIRYFLWLGSILKLDFGLSFLHSRPVKDLIGEAIPATLSLALVATIISFLIAIPAGIISALKKNTIVDYFFSMISFIGVSLPSFWFGLMLILLFSLKLRWLPTGGMRSNFDEFVLVDRIKHMILPATVMAMGNMAAKMRYMRSSMLEVIKQDYIRTARSKGLSERVVIFKHAFRNSLLPIITMLGFIIPNLFSGAAILETIFSWPGLGRLTVEANFMRDYPVLMGATIISSALVILGSLIADILYAVADPRIKYN
jgi:peptide/nickel transport system permease protein